MTNPKFFTIVNTNYVESELSVRSTAQLEEEIKKELKSQQSTVFGVGSGTPINFSKVVSPPIDPE